MDFSSILILTLCFACLCNLDEINKLEIELDKEKKQVSLYRLKLSECDSAYTINRIKLDSVNRANKNASDRVLGYLREEYRYKKSK